MSKILENSNKKKKSSFLKKLLADALIISGIAILIYLLLPYATLIVFSGRRGELNKKVQASSYKEDRIIIPSILIDAPLREGTNEKVLSSNIGIYQDGSRPGQNGNTILEGHNITEFGFFIGSNNLFSLLDLIKKKSNVYLFYKGKKYIYEVSNKKRIKVINPKLYDSSDDERLTLITCATSWSPSIKTDWRVRITCYPVND